MKEALMNSEVPKTPWGIVAADLFECVRATYLVGVDYYSEFIEIEKLENDACSSSVIDAMSKTFDVHDITVKSLWTMDLSLCCLNSVNSHVNGISCGLAVTQLMHNRTVWQYRWPRTSSLNAQKMVALLLNLQKCILCM